MTNRKSKLLKWVVIKMIKFKTNHSISGLPVLGLGLSDRNIELLKQRRPVLVDGREMGIDFDVFLFWEPTESDIINVLHEKGLINDQDFELIIEGPKPGQKLNG